MKCLFQKSSVFLTIIKTKFNLISNRFVKRVMSSTLESYVNHTVSVITADGRQIVGTLKGFDQTVNVILDDSHERVYSASHGVEQVPLGLYIVRGDNVLSSQWSPEIASEIDDLIDTYRQFARTPIPISGQLLSGDNETEKSVRIVWKVRDMDRLEATKFATNHTIKMSDNLNGIKQISTVGQPIDVSNELNVAFTTKGAKYRAVVRKGDKESDSGKVKQWLEIWDKTTKLKSIDIESLDEHSSLVLDSLFGRFLWSPDGKRLLYVAEYKVPKAQSYYKKQTKKANKSDKDYDTRGQEFVYRDDWGEGFNGLVHTVVAVLDVEADYKITTIELKDYTLGEPFWVGSGDSVGFVGWDERPRRLGITYCSNRLSSIYTFDLNSENSVPKLICGTDKTTVRNPWPNPDGQSFIYLENESGGPHRKASRLMRYSYETKANEVLIDSSGVRQIIENPNDNIVKYGKLSALFIDELPENGFTSDGKYLVINVLTELQQRLCLVDLKTPTLKPIEFPLQSAHVLDFKDNLIIAVGSAINIRPNVFVGKLNDDNTEAIDWKEIQWNSSQDLNEICFENYSIVSEDPKKLLDFILVTPKAVETEAAPTVVWPHGGPHSVLTNTYMSYPLMFAKLGLKTLLINYRGSIGVDEDYVNDLTGYVGDKDVKDLIKCIEYLSDKCLVDSSKLVLFGGSHGGFLVTHLSGQYSHWNFKACIARNPVVDLSTKLDGTDIPDWGFVESFGQSKQFSFDSLLDPDSLKVMFDKSPVKWIQNVKVPTLMLLGRRDRRVPYTQGLKWYRILKARGVKSECRMYDDKHDLAKVDVDSDAAIHICVWILNHLSNN